MWVMGAGVLRSQTPLAGAPLGRRLHVSPGRLMCGTCAACPAPDPEGDSSHLEPVSLQGWNGLDGAYAFRYVGPRGEPGWLRWKCGGKRGLTCLGPRRCFLALLPGGAWRRRDLRAKF